MGISLLMALASPVTWLLVAAIASMWRRGRGKKVAVQQQHAAAAHGDTVAGARRRGVMPGAALDVGAAFLFLSTAYRPSLEFMVKAQLRQVEDVDEDDQGGPETPQRHLHRQLRRIRRGEPVERLVWRLE